MKHSTNMTEMLSWRSLLQPRLRLRRWARFIGREAIEKYYGSLFQNLQPQGRATKIDYLYTYGADLCALGGWIVTIHGSQQVGGFLINIYTQVRGTWKIRTSVFNYATDS
jgi:hypothetical protein